MWSKFLTNVFATVLNTNRNTMCIRVNLYLWYFTVLFLYHLSIPCIVVVLTCFVMYVCGGRGLLCVCVCVGFVMCVCVGFIMCVCVYVCVL
jgi:hypothetical protein